jgi:RNA polymerase sigma-70 factor, ECF subfamily
LGEKALLLESTLSWHSAAQEFRLPRPDDAQSRGGSLFERPADAARAEDSFLAESCRSGSVEAYEHLYATQSARMKSVAMNLLGNRQDAEDAVQETFLKIHRGIRYFKGQSAFSTWTYRILINSCYDLRRRRMRRQETPEQDLVEEGETFEVPVPGSNHPLRLALEKCVARLTPHLRTVFLLFEVEGFKHSEIGEVLGISEMASKNALYQAKRRLREMLSEPPGAAKGAE